MLTMLTSNIMPRTTLDLDPSVLDELRRRGERERKSMGTVASELLSVILAESEDAHKAAPALKWVSRDLGAPRVDLEDKEALRRALDAGS
jgi:broad-specificity NMP kinase